jgi:NitT/TauT family transport system substrate-binding protein
MNFRSDGGHGRRGAYGTCARRRADPGSGADVDPRRLHPVITWLPAWVAKEKGFFAKHGLDVTLSVAQNLSILPGTVGRQFEFVPSTAPDLLKAVASGLDVVAVAASVFETEDNVSTQLMVAKDSGIASAKDLSGKLIATPTIGGVIHVSVLYWLKKNGVDPPASAPSRSHSRTWRTS